MTISIQTREIQYNAADGQRLVGYFAAPSSQTPHAGIIVAPEWWGRNEYTEQRDKNVTTDAKQAYEWMMQTFADVDTIVNRAQAGLDTLAAQPEVNPTQLAAIGFCYGGKVVLDLARSGAPLKAVATFHATLAPKAPAVEGQIQGEILVLHGELDSMVTLDDVASFREEMHAAKVDHEVIIFEDAKHGFSNPLADERAKANGVDLGYNPEAERQGLDAMYDLLERNLSA